MVEYSSPNKLFINFEQSVNNLLEIFFALFSPASHELWVKL